MKLTAAAGLLALSLPLASPTAKSARDGGNPRIFDRHDPVELTIEAPLQQLFDNGTTNERYTVRGSVSLNAPEGAGPTVMRDVEISVRGNTSKRESECPFPKLKLSFSDKPDTPLLEGLDSLKIGTHCGEAADGALTRRFGRLAHESAPWREALVYRMLAAAGATALKARPARITYVDGRMSTSPLVRQAMLVEGDDDVKKRLGGEEEIPMERFGNARDHFNAADTSRLAFAEALIGNFDWCLRFSADDTYRCDQRKPLWNILVFRGKDKTFPVMKDFDLAGPVTARHPWFRNVYNETFAASRSQIEVEVVSQVQRTRSLFPRDVLDRTRKEFMAHRAAIEQAIAGASVDAQGRTLAHQYARAFFDAIADDAFYRPVVVRPNTRLYRDAARSADACGGGDTLPLGTPVNVRQRSASMAEVVVLDAMWRWAPPARCDAVRRGTVWIESSAIGAGYPDAPQTNR